MTTQLTTGNTEEKVYSILESPELDPDLTPDQRIAMQSHYNVMSAVKTGKSASNIIRREAAKLYLTNGYKELKLPYNDNSEMKLSFDDFISWCNYIADANDMSGSFASTLANFTTCVVDPVSKRLVDNYKTGKPYTVEEILALPEGKTQKIASAAHRLLESDKSDEEKKKILSQVVNVATDPSVITETFTEMLEAYDLKTRRNPLLQVDMAYTGDKVVFLLVVDERQEAQARLPFQSRAELRTRTIDDLLASLKTLRPDEEFDEDSFSEFIKSKE